MRVVRAVPTDEVIFLPDQNLGHYVATQVPEKKIISGPAICRTHHRVRVEDVEQARAAYPDAPAPGPSRVPAAGRGPGGLCRQHLTDHRQGRALKEQTLIIGTEMGILHQLKRENPGKTFFLLTPGLVCPNMKRTSTERVRDGLRDLKPEVTVPEPVRSRAAAGAAIGCWRWGESEYRIAYTLGNADCRT